jgi:hypothetical protein
VRGLKLATSWTLGANDQAELKRQYVLSKAKGLDKNKDSDEFEIIGNTLEAMGFGVLSKGHRVDSTGEIRIRAPPAGEVRERVVQQLGDWFEASEGYRSKSERRVRREGVRGGAWELNRNLKRASQEAAP